MTKENNTALLDVFELFAKTYFKTISLESLLSGLPDAPGGSDSQQNQLLERVAKRAGYNCKLIERELGSISNLILPCILLLKDGNACILEALNTGEGKAKIITLDTPDSESWVQLSVLDEEYLGFAYLVKKKYQFQERALELVQLHREHWFWDTLKKSKHIYISVLLASVFINLFITATPLFTMNVYDRVVPNDAIETLWVLAIGVIAVYVLDAILRATRNYLLEIAGERSDVIMSSILFEHTLGLKMEAWPRSVGSFASTIKEFDAIRNFFASATIVSLVDIPFAIIFLFLIAFIGGYVVVVHLVVVAILIALALLMVGPLKRGAESSYEAVANKNALLIESLHSILTIKTMGRSRQAQWEWEEATGDIANKSKNTRLVSGTLSVFINILANATTVGTIIVGVYAVRNLDLTLGGLIACVILGSRVIAPVSQLASLILQYESTKVSFSNLDQLMNSPVERPLAKSFVSPPKFTGDIIFKDVSFRYPGVENKALDAVSLQIKQGERVGIIGRMGSGKSTLVNLLLNLYSPSSGLITASSIDVQQLDPAELRRNMAFLSHDGDMLRGTIKDNITYKDPHIDDEQMLRAAMLGGVDQFINKQPMGFDTPVGEQGRGLSGGQQQSISIARALLLDTPVVILDEPTSAMDNAMEGLVRQRLDEYLKGKTLLLITHKTSMLDLVDRLVVLNDGKLILDGPKEEVLTKLKEGAA